MGILVIGGLVQAAGRGFATVPPPHISATAVLGPLLILRAFASGATSMTGIEAVSNAVPVFRDVQWRASSWPSPSRRPGWWCTGGAAGTGTGAAASW
jgi:hypothetical protein